MDGDLISRAEALKAIEKLFVDGKFGIYNDGSEIFAKCHNAISNVPAVDAEPVRRAQWKAANRRGTLCDTYVCSECGNILEVRAVIEGINIGQESHEHGLEATT